MRAQVEHAEATAQQAEAADGALDEIVGAMPPSPTPPSALPM
jgi:hypothetical protein